MSMRKRLDRLKWCGALGVALVLHIAVFWGFLPEAFPPPLAQPASTRVLIISLPFFEPPPTVDLRASEAPPERAEAPIPLVAEVSPMEMEVNASEGDRAHDRVPDPLPEPERAVTNPDFEPQLTSELEQAFVVQPPIVDQPVPQEPSVPFKDSVLAVEDQVDVDGLFDVPPRALQTIEPNYPFEARRKKREGDVLCEAVITKRGRVETAHVVVSSGYHKLDDAALVALRRARFEPATRRGRSVDATVRITIVFRLARR